MTAYRVEVECVSETGAFRVIRRYAVEGTSLLLQPREMIREILLLDREHAENADDGPPRAERSEAP